MKQNTLIETRGMIIKEETVKALDDKILSNTLVLESINPYTGYYGKNFPDVEKPRSVFIILDKEYDGLFLARALQNIAAKRLHRCYGAYGTLEFTDGTLHCVRIKNLECFDDLLEIQQMMLEEGLRFHKYSHLEKTALIRINKSFLFEEIAEGIFKDNFEPDRYYITIPFSIDFETFRKITSDVKNNIDNNLFDAALGLIWRIDGIVDLVRIYDKNQSIDRVRKIRDMYQIQFKQLTHIVHPVGE